MRFQRGSRLLPKGSVIVQATDILGEHSHVISLDFRNSSHFKRLVFGKITKSAPLLRLSMAWSAPRQVGICLSFQHRRQWAGAGFKDTLLRWKMKPEVV